MESDSNRTNLFIFLALIGILLAVTFIILITNLINHQRKVNNRNTNDTTIIDDNPTTNVTTVYSGHEMGDKVTLLDSTSWHVILESDINEEEVTILKDEALSTKMDKYTAIDYLNNTYLDYLNETLDCDYEITDAHLLSKEEIKKITRIGNPRKDTIFKADEYEWLTMSNTLTNIINDDELLSICEKDNDKEPSLCVLDTETYPIRPVIKVSKNCLK